MESKTLCDLGKKFTSILHCSIFSVYKPGNKCLPYSLWTFPKDQNFSLYQWFLLISKILCLFSSVPSLQCSQFPHVEWSQVHSSPRVWVWASKCSATILLIRKSRRLRKLTSPKSQVINCGFKNRINFIVISKKNEIPSNRPTKGGSVPYSGKL